MLLGAAGLVLTTSSVVASSGAATSARRTTTSSSTSTTLAPTTSTTAPAKGPIVLENGGTVSVAVPNLPFNLNPYTAGRAAGPTAMVASMIWPSVFSVGGGFTLVLNQALVTNAEVVGVTPQRVEYQIDPHATWSDGVPITARDFIYVWHELRTQVGQLAPSTLAAGYADISSITSANGGKTVFVSFAKPYVDWEGLFSPLLPAHLASVANFATGYSPTDPTTAISGGPFIIQSYAADNRIVLVRNPTYWGNPANLSSIVLKVVRGQAAILSALERGTVDIGMLAPSPSLRAAIDASGTLLARSVATPTLWQLDFNLADPTLSDVRVRDALAQVINRWELVWDTIGRQTRNVNVAANRLFLSGFPGSAGGDSGFQQVNYVNATTLFADAGYTIATTGPSAGLLVGPGGRPLRLELVGPASDPLVTSLEQLLKAQLLSAGIELDISTVPETDLLSLLLPTGNYQLALAPYQLSSFPSANAAAFSGPVGPTPVTPGVASTSTNSDLEPGALGNGGVTADVNGFSDAEVDSLFEQASQQLTRPRAAGFYDSADARLWQDLPTLPLFQIPATLVWRVGIDNLSYAASPAGITWDAAQWGIQISPTPTVPTTTLVGGVTTSSSSSTTSTGTP